MRWLRRIRSLLFGSRLDTQLTEELDFHLEEQTKLNIQLGMTSDEARAAARRSFGAAGAIREECHDARRVTSVEILFRDLALAARALRRTPAFTAAAVLTLALAIGGNTAIFSIVDAVVLRSLPYPESDRLAALWEINREGHGDRSVVAPGNFVDYRRLNRAFLDMTAWTTQGLNLTAAGAPERLPGIQATAGFFELLGVQPVLGRTFRPEEDRPGANRVVLLSHELWTRRFGSDAAILGRSIPLEGIPHEVIGVLPPGFVPPSHFGSAENVQVYTPVGFDAELLSHRGDHEARVAARLRPGVSLAEAQSDMDSISATLEKTFPDANRNIRTELTPLREDIVRRVRTSLLVLLGAVALILLIACVNVANLMMVRAVGRKREIAMRLALGAGRARVAGELFAQSLLLAWAGGLLGLVFGLFAQRLLVALAPAGIPRLSGVTLDLRVLLFAFFLSLFTSLLFGVWPAWQVSGIRPNETLKISERSSASPAVLRWRNAFLVVQLALSLILLIGAGLLLRSFALLDGVQLGFEADSVLAVTVPLPQSGYPSPAARLRFFEDLEQRLGRIPGVRTAAFANRLPMRGGWDTGIGTDVGDRASVESYAVSESFFETLAMPLRAGRLLSVTDREGAPRVIVVNERMAAKYFPGQQVLGHRVRRGPEAPWLEIVGVVADAHLRGKDSEIKPQIFIPAAQTGSYPVHLADVAVRVAGDPLSILPSVRAEVLALDREQPITDAISLGKVAWNWIAPRRFQALLISLFAALAFFLAISGLYGVIAYSVSQRTAEFGIRVTLGADPARIRSLVLRQASWVLVFGIALGLAGAFAASRVLTSFLYEVRPTDPATFFGISTVLLVVALAACLIPARRAARLDPVLALRDE